MDHLRPMKPIPTGYRLSQPIDRPLYGYRKLAA